MADAPPQRYQRLPGTGYRQLVPGWAMILLFFVIGIFVLLLRGRRVQLWRGEDHLLVVDWDGYREYYKRINYRDIQSVIIRRTAEGLITNSILGVLMLLLVGLGVGIGDNVGMVVLFVLAGLLGILLLGNFLQGPTCKCQLRTAVQTEDLHSLTRLRTARKALDQLRPLIVAAQGELPTSEIAQRLQTWAAGGAPASVIVDDPNAPPRMVS